MVTKRIKKREFEEMIYFYVWQQLIMLIFPSLESVYDFKSTEFQQQKISFLRRLLCVHFLTLIVNATEETAQDIKIKHREIHLRILVL